MHKRERKKWEVNTEKKCWEVDSEKKNLGKKGRYRKKVNQQRK